jgi:nitroreductase
MSDVVECLRHRRSVRKYNTEPVPEAVLERVLEAARIAPSAGNAQPWKFIVVRDPETKAQLVEACRGQQFIAHADCVIIACGLPEKARHIGGRWSAVQVDVAAAFTQLLLQAKAEGLGACWIGAYEEAKVKTLLGIPEEADVLALTPLGWPEEDPAGPPRKALDDIVCWERWS